MSETPAAQEVIVVQRDDSRSMRRILWALIIVVSVALAALLVFLLLALRPLGTPESATDETGLTWIRSIYGWGEGPEDLLAQPTDVAVGPNGIIWATDPTRGRVLGFTPEGQLAQILGTGTPGMGTGLIGRPEGVGVDADGNVYVADFLNGKVIQFDSGAQFVREWDVPSPLDVATRDGEIAVSTVYGVAFFDDAGGFVRRIGMRGKAEDQFDIAHGVALADDATLYVADTQNSRVKALNRDDDLLWVKGAPTGMEPRAVESEDEAAQAFQLPTGIAIDGAGRLVIVDPFEFGLIVLDATDGSVLDEYGSYGAEDGKFLYPTGIAYDPARDYFVIADTTNNRLQVVTIPGSGGGVVAAARRSLAGPVWLCAVPLLLLVLALIWIRRNRRRAAL